MGHSPPRGLSVDWWKITSTNPAGTNGLTCLPKHGDARDNTFLVTPPMTDLCECFLAFAITRERTDHWGIELLTLDSYFPLIVLLNYLLLCTAGPLSQWELIFYGTETPPQEFDASPETNALGQKTGPAVPSWNTPEEPESVEEVRQNAIDDDLALVWHDSHTVSFNIISIHFRFM
jgi:hypothetical protein